MGKTKETTMFQSTLPRRERLTILSITLLITKFQSTLPRRERPFSKATTVRVLEFQSTLPRRERRNLKVVEPSPLVSIHAPTQGATGLSVPPASLTPCFNPRSHAGSDLTVNDAQIIIVRFNPRSHAGSDVYNKLWRRTHFTFQSTLPRRERP